MGEDSYAIDVRPRLEVAGGIIKNVTVLKGSLRLPDDRAELICKVMETGDVGMVVIDPLAGALGAGKSSNQDSDVRPALTCLNIIADHAGCIVVGVRHITNKLMTDVLAGVIGSSDWVNVPRATLALAHDDQDDDIRHLSVITGNRVKSGTGRQYRIVGVVPPHGGEEVTRAEHVGESHKSMDDLLETGRPTTKSGQARELILDTLEEAPGRRYESDALDALVAEQTGLSVRTIQNQRGRLVSEGLIRSQQVRDKSGVVTGWVVERTNAPSEVVERGGSTTTQTPHADQITYKSPNTNSSDVESMWKGTGNYITPPPLLHDLGSPEVSGQRAEVAASTPPTSDEELEKIRLEYEAKAKRDFERLSGE